MEKIKVIGYFVDRLNENENPSANSVFIIIDEVSHNKANLNIYCPIGQHGYTTRNYLPECTEITKEQYIEYSKGFYTPEEYL